MAPQTQPPSSPTSLLWAHQMKREHSFLLTRMQKLEAAISRIEAIATANHKKEVDMAEIAKTFQTLAAEGKKKNDDATELAIERVRREVTDQFKELDGRLEAIIDKLDSVDRTVEHATSSGTSALEREVEMLNRVERLDEGMKNFRENMRLLGRMVDDRSTEQVQAQVQQLVQRAKDAGDDHEVVKETVAMLERAVEAMKEENKQLESQIQTAREEMGAKAAENAMSVRALQAAQSAMQASTAYNVATSQKAPAEMSATTTAIADVPHAANGPDDVNASNTKRKDEVHADAAITPNTESNMKSVHGAISPPIQLEKVLGRRTAAKPMKRELGGLQTEIISKRRKVQPADGTGAGHYKKPSSTARPTRQRKPLTLTSTDTATDTKSQMPIVRKGKGWVEIAEPVEEGEAEDIAELAPPSIAKASPVPTAGTDFAGNPIKIKQGRGRPRKTPTPAVEAAEPQAQPPKRSRGRPRKVIGKPAVENFMERAESPASKHRAVVNNEDSESRGTTGRVTKRKAGAIDDAVEVLAPRVTRSQRGALAPARAPDPTKRGKKTATNVTVAETNTGAVTPPAARKRRRGLTGMFSSPISSPPDGIDQAQGPHHVQSEAVSKSSSNDPPPARRRTIPQLGIVSALPTNNDQVAVAQLPEVVFDRDFEM